MHRKSAPGVTQLTEGAGTDAAGPDDEAAAGVDARLGTADSDNGATTDTDVGLEAAGSDNGATADKDA